VARNHLCLPPGCPFLHEGVDASDLGKRLLPLDCLPKPSKALWHACRNRRKAWTPRIDSNGW
jgi:hypothetical protein